MKLSSLKNQLEADIQVAIQQQNEAKLKTLKSIYASILQEEHSRNRSNLTKYMTTRVLHRAMQERQVAAEEYRRRGEIVLAQIEQNELEIIRQYLPPQLPEQEVSATITQIIKSINATGMHDFRRVVFLAKKEFADRVESRVVTRMVREKLRSLS